MAVLYIGECIRWKRGKTDYRFRVVAYDDATTQYALFDLDRDEKLADSRDFSIVQASELEPLVGHAVARLDYDPAREDFPDEATLKEKHGDRIAKRTKNWELVQYLFGKAGKNDEPGELPFGQPVARIFFDVHWRRYCVRRLAKQKGVSTKRIYDLFWTAVRFGGDRRALTPRDHRIGNKGRLKSMSARPTTSGVKNSDFYHDAESYKPKDRMSPFWWGRVMAQLIAKIACQPEQARTDFLDIPALEKEFRAEYCLVQAKPSRALRRKIASRRIPPTENLRRHMRRKIDALDDEIDGALPEVKPGPPAGKATDIGSANEVIVDMDMTEISIVRIVVPDETRTVWRCVGAPRVVIGVVRGSDYPAGWFVTIGPEDKDAYCYALLSILADKDVYLRRLGRKDAIPALPSGNIDRVVTDGGAGSGKDHNVFVLETLKVDFSKVGPYNPEGKGNVEGTNKRVKDGLMGRLVATKTLREGLVRSIVTADRSHPSAKRYGKVKDAPKSNVPIVFMVLDDFERVLVDVMMDLVLKWRDAPALQTQDAFVKGRQPTRLEAFRDQQRRRRGDGAVRWTTERIRQAIFERRLKRNVLVTKGRITLGRNEYGAEGAGVANTREVQALQTWERRMRRKGKEPLVNAMVDEAYEGAICKLPDGTWLSLPPTRETLRKAGNCMRTALQRPQRQYWLSSRRKQKAAAEDAAAASSGKPKRSGLTVEQQKEQKRIKKRLTGVSGRSPKTPEAAAALQAARSAQAGLDAKAARAPAAKKPKPESVKPLLYAPRNRSASASTFAALQAGLSKPKD